MALRLTAKTASQIAAIPWQSTQPVKLDASDIR